MRTPFSRLLGAQRVGMDKTVVGQAPTRRNLTGIDVTVAIFFDGTGNNRNNVAQRHMNQQHTQEEDGISRNNSFPTYGLKRDGSLTNTSYAAGYSNVSILERLNIKRETAKREISIYVEGIGTTDNGDDDTPGSAFGKWKTGVTGKVKRGVMLLGKQIAAILSQERSSYVKKITIDVFGFSRGAAAARHFVAQVHDKTPLAAQLGTPQAEVLIKFVGLFDTVSSYGFGLGFGSSVAELGLALGGLPERVVQLTAGHEYRQNFSLTDITSSLGKGYELTLPGVHSNIGGSYGENEDEVRNLNLWERSELVRLGWYTEQEAKIHSQPIYDPETREQMGTEQWVVGTRKNLGQEYQFIPLRIMAEKAKPHEVELESLSGRFGKYSISPNHALAPIQAAILDGVKHHQDTGRYALELADEICQKPPGAHATRLAISDAQAVLLRNRYLRRSASIGIQGLTDGWDRKGMGERREHGKPHRFIFPG